MNRSKLLGSHEGFREDLLLSMLTLFRADEGPSSPSVSPSGALFSGAVACLLSVRARLCQGVSGALLVRLRVGEAPIVSDDSAGDSSPWTAELYVGELLNFSSRFGPVLPASREPRRLPIAPLSEGGPGPGRLADSLAAHRRRVYSPR